ncbi:MAG TPA: hypothetical protein DEA96_08885 [Leptospiraceae bacterium]|nr:hypothetical protein [Spirochaetaceae bacterium]HBS05066.1 hypothetical protein [Leptospiraceae bacterium]|tara:strand:+ start:28895 stop:29323 length:429 start_codon:yes stop_codon:yes gene_type:complete
MNVGKFVHPVYTTATHLPRKQKAGWAGRSISVFLIAASLGLHLFSDATVAEDFAELPAMPETPSLDFDSEEAPISESWKENDSIVQAYEIWDAHYCTLTPKPFLCRQCIRSDQQFVRIIQFESGRPPVRSYECRPFKKPYLY